MGSKSCGAQTLKQKKQANNKQQQKRGAPPRLLLLRVHAPMPLSLLLLVRRVLHLAALPEWRHAVPGRDWLLQQEVLDLKHAQDLNQTRRHLLKLPSAIIPSLLVKLLQPRQLCHEDCIQLNQTHTQQAVVLSGLGREEKKGGLVHQACSCV